MYKFLQYDIGNIMPSDKPKLLLVIDEELLTRVDRYRFENWIPSRAKAVRELLQKALDAEEKAGKKKK